MTGGEDQYATFFIGDSDLVLLGIAAAIAARHHAMRKRLRSMTDADAREQLVLGFGLGLSVPLDDVPEVKVSLHAPKDSLAKIRALANELFDT